MAFLLLSVAPVRAQKEVLILLPLNVDQSLKEQSALLGTALQQGLNKNFDVYFGPAVEEKLEKEYAKADCTATSCAENVAIAFNGELIGDASVQLVDNSYVLQVQLNNVVTGRIVGSMLEICEGCSKLQLLTFVTEAGRKVQPTSRLPAAAAPTPSTPQKPKAALVALTITTVPTQAQVVIDNRVVGNSPLTTDELEVGSVIEIALSKSGFRTRRVKHRVGTDDLKLLNLELAAVGPNKTKNPVPPVAQQTPPPERFKIRAPVGF